MGSVYEEILKVPLIIVEMGKKPIKKEVSDVVQLIDIAPTILDYFGISIPENYQGTSLIPVLEGKKVQKDRIIISECYQNKGLMKRNRKEGYILLSIRKQDWKYIYNEEKEDEYLFDLGNDPTETVNLIGENYKMVDDFRKIKEMHLRNALKSNEEKSRIMKAIKSIDLK
jgi:arylsulfatase A-like enzyme